MQKKKSKQRTVSKKRAAKPGNKKSGGKTATPVKNDGSAAKHEQSSLSIALESVVTISEAESLHKKLQGYLDLGGDLSIDAGQVHMIDTAGLQLLLAFVVELKNQNRSVKWLNVSPAFKETAELLGLTAPLGMR